MKDITQAPHWRILAMILLAFTLYGGWAFAVNITYDFNTALRAGLAQGISSSVSTLIISSVIEYCYFKCKQKCMGLVLAWVIPPTLTAFMHAGFQWVVNTPEIVETISLSVMMGYVFSGFYVRTLMHLGEIPQNSNLQP